MPRSSQVKTDNERKLSYELDECPPPLLSLGLGLQYTLLTITPIVLVPTVIIRNTHLTQSYLSWCIFAAFIAVGITTLLQGMRIGLLGAGNLTIMGVSAAYMAICHQALLSGGPALMATLVTVSALLQFILAAKLSLIRRIVTPAVVGTLMMLIPVAVMPVIFKLLQEKTTQSAYSGLNATITIIVIAALTLYLKGFWRIWALLIGTIIGYFLAIPMGLVDFSPIIEANWFGIPLNGRPENGFIFNSDFWGLLPGFFLITLVLTIKTVGDSMAIQGISWRRPRTTDFRTIQRSISTQGFGNLLCGLLATVPITTYSGGVAAAELTGVTSRRITFYACFCFITIALLPKITAVLLSIPPSVTAAYMLVVMSTLFSQGMKIVVKEENTRDVAIISGLSFWIAIAVENNMLMSRTNQWWDTILTSGLTVGGIMAISLSSFRELFSPTHYMKTTLSLKSIGNTQQFLEKLISANWSSKARENLYAAVEETILILIQDEQTSKHLMVTARISNKLAELEFMTGGNRENLEDHLLLIKTSSTNIGGGDIPLRLLQHFTSSIHHQQYLDGDIVTITVSN